MNLIQRLCLGILALISSPGLADDTGEGAPAVRAVLFYHADSRQSRELFAFYLPGLAERYGSRLEVSGIDVSQPSGARAYSAMAEHWRLPLQSAEAPVIVAGNRSLVGLIAIAEALGDNFEEIARDPSAARWPSVPALAELLPDGLQDIKMRVAREGVPPAADRLLPPSSDTLPTRDRIANGLAVAVLVGMVVALIHSLMQLRRRGGKTTGRVATWALPVTLLVGLGISGYTAYTALANVVPMCGPIGSCAAVQDSEYAKILGVPMGVLGLVGYSLIFVTWLIARSLSPRGGGWYWLPWAIALLGVLFSLRLTALEPFVIGATCLWCLGSAVSMTITFWLLSGYARGGDTPPPSPTIGHGG
jgi:uncharacterized membrane protein